MPLYGLIGYPLDHSWSKQYFDRKFASLDLSQNEYMLFPIEQIGSLPALIHAMPGLQGLNVTIPYKTAVIPFIDHLDASASAIGAVNTVNIIRSADGHHLIGYNTDAYGFSESIKPFLKPHWKRAIILGTGGAAKAVKYVFHNLGIQCHMISRTPQCPGQINYSQLDENVIRDAQIIVNATPVGLFPNIHDYPEIPYRAINAGHFVVDLIYYPEKTIFLQKAEKNGATTVNGLNMLNLQAEKSWEIWINSRRPPTAI